MLQTLKKISNKLTKKQNHKRLQTDKPALQKDSRDDLRQPGKVAPEQMDTSMAEKIVNEYGRTMVIFNQLNRIRMENLTTDPEAKVQTANGSCEGSPDTCEPLNDIASHKPGPAILPYPPDTIKKAIELLLEYEKDDYNIETLRLGLKYLEYFN